MSSVVAVNRDDTRRWTARWVMLGDAALLESDARVVLMVVSTPKLEKDASVRIVDLSKNRHGSLASCM